MRTKIAFLLVLTIGLCWAADLRQLSARIESILNETDEERIPKLTESLVSEMDTAVETATPEDIVALLPLAKRSILSSKPKVRGPGLLLLISVGQRPDSANLLEPYIDDLGPLLKDSDQPTRNVILLILGGARAAPSGKALLYLLEHINDKKAQPMEIAAAAAGLLRPGRPLDPAILHNVLNVVQERGDRSLRIAILQQLSLNQITNDEAQKFIKSGLADADHFIRRAAVEAAGRMSKEVREKFRTDIVRIAANPDESPETRSLADSVLRQ